MLPVHVDILYINDDNIKFKHELYGHNRFTGIPTKKHSKCLFSWAIDYNPALKKII